MKSVQVQIRPHQQPHRYLVETLQVKLGDWVVVEVQDESQDCGKVISLPERVPPEWEMLDLPRVLYIATEEEIEKSQQQRKLEESAQTITREIIKEKELDMDLVSVEYAFKGNKIKFYFTSEARVDFRDLVRVLAQKFHARIEMRQIGVRDKSALIGGFGHCGQQLCCCRFLNEFKPVTIKMAKDQRLALNPTKISGQCGRLMCCLRYEHNQYAEGLMPKTAPPPLDEIIE